MKKTAFITSILSAVVLNTNIATAQDNTNDASITNSAFGESNSPRRHEIYIKGGFLGIGAGYAFGINENFTIRADANTIGTYNYNGHSNKLKFDADVKNDQFTLYGDWFPFTNNGFRITAGVGYRDTKITANGRPEANGVITVGNVSVPYGAGDSVKGKVKFDDFTPYLGIGYGHNVGQYSKAGWGFIADLGFYFGSPKTTINTSESLMKKMDYVTGSRARTLNEIENQRKKADDYAKDFYVFPSAYIGVSYRF